MFECRHMELDLVLLVTVSIVINLHYHKQQTHMIKGINNYFAVVVYSLQRRPLTDLMTLSYANENDISKASVL